MSANLNAPALVGGQANPETTVNDAIGVLDAAITEELTVDCTNNVDLTAAQYRSAFKYKLTPVGASKTLTLEAIKRFVYIQNSGANQISVVIGSTSLPLNSGSSALFYSDGTANGLEQMSVTGSQPHDMHVFFPGSPSASQLVLRFVATRAFVLPASLTGSAFSAVTASTGTATFTLKKNGASIGTIAFTASATGVATFASQVSFAVNDVFTIEAPGSADATLADISFDFAGTR